MKKCPKCNFDLADEATKCPKCNYNLLSSQETKVMTKPQMLTRAPQAYKKPLYKKPIVVVPVALGLFLLIVLGVWFYLANQQTRSYQEKVKSIWNEIALASTGLKGNINTTDGTEDFSNLSEGLADQNDLLKDKLVEAKEIEAPSNYQKSQQKFEEALESYSDYISAAQAVVDADVEKVTEQRFNNLSSLGSEAKIACDQFIEESDFTKESIPPKVFKLAEVLRPIIKEAQGQRKEEEQKRKEEQQKKKEAEEQQAAEAAVSGWMSALKDKNFQAMSQYMTPDAYQKIKPEDFEGDYTIVDFVITKTNRLSLTEFEIFVTESDQWPDGAKTTTERLFTVVEANNKWLISNQRVVY